VGEVFTLTNHSQDGGDLAKNLQYLWDFGDNNHSIAFQPTHSYQAIGLYTVTLIVTNSITQSQFTHLITVQDEPIADLALIQTGSLTVGHGFTLTAVAPHGSNITFIWGSNAQKAARFGASSQQSFNLPVGEHTLWVTASNSANSQIMSHTVNIKDEAMAEVTLSVQPTIQLGQPLTLTAAASIGTNLQYLWNFGDGETMVSANGVISHYYQMAGSYVVQVTVQNGLGSNTMSQTVTVLACEEITALQVAHPPLVWVGQSTTFTAVTATGSDITFQWHLGDNLGPQTGAIIQHNYTEPGQQTVILTATNCWGTLVTKSLLTVQDAPIEGLRIESPSRVMVNQPFTVTAVVTQGTNLVYEWWFDNETKLIGQTVNYSYQTSGLHPLTVIVRNSVAEVQATEPLMVGSIKAIFLPIISRMP
jgi:PKD repeat protein